MQESIRRVVLALLFMVGLLLTGTVGYILLEGWGFLDALWMTVITMSTVGFGEVAPMDTAGKVLTLVIIIMTLGSGTYAIGTISAFLIEGEILNIMRGRNLERKIDKLTGHAILVGFGAVGREAAKWWHKDGQLVIIEQDQAIAEEARQAGYNVLVGDATRESILNKARIQDAVGLMLAMQNLADCVLIALTARDLKPDIIISARADNPDGVRRLNRVGVNQVISPSEIGGRRLAEFLKQPAIVEFLDLVMHRDQVNLRLATVEVLQNSRLSGVTIKEAHIRHQTNGASVMSIRRKDGRQEMVPDPSYRMEVGDVLIALGSDEMLEKLVEMAGKV